MSPHLNLDMEKRTWKERKDYSPDVTIVTALFNGQQTGVPHTVGVYTTEWVDKLYRGIERNYSGKFNFICLTDQNYRFGENIIGERFSRSVDQYGWMSLMELYRPELCSGIRVTLGLDTVITGSLDEIFKYKPEKFAVCKDPFYPEEICNAITMSTPEFCEEFWSWWVNNEEDLMRECTLFGAPSEMILMRKYYGASPVLDMMFPGIASYKAHVLPRFVTVEQSNIIYFHGEPKPHQLNDKWLRRHWV